VDDPRRFSDTMADAAAVTGTTAITGTTAVAGTVTVAGTTAVAGIIAVAGTAGLAGTTIVAAAAFEDYRTIVRRRLSGLRISTTVYRFPRNDRINPANYTGNEVWTLRAGTRNDTTPPPPARFIGSTVCESSPPRRSSPARRDPRRSGLAEWRRTKRRGSPETRRDCVSSDSWTAWHPTAGRHDTRQPNGTSPSSPPRYRPFHWKRGVRDTAIQKP